MGVRDIEERLSLLGNEETQLTKLLKPIQRTTQIRTRPRATQQGRVKCRCLVPFQWSQHREQSRRRADTKKEEKKSLDTKSWVIYRKVVRLTALVWGLVTYTIMEQSMKDQRYILVLQAEHPALNFMSSLFVLLTLCSALYFSESLKAAQNFSYGISKNMHSQ